jgi:hypothetical protein
MLNAMYIEMQTNKRIQKFLLHKSTEANIEPAQAKLVVTTDGKTITTLLLENNRVVKAIGIKEITGFFGRTHDEFNTTAIIAYLNKIALTNQISLNELNIVICESKGKVGTHLYAGTKHKQKLSTVDFLTHFNTLN